MDIATGVKEGNITTIAVLMAVLMLSRIAINAWNARVESVTYARMNFIIRQRLYSNLLQAQWQGKEKMHTGDTLNRLFSDVDAITRVICQEFPSFLTTIIQLIAAIVFMCLMDWRLALILILIMPFFVFFGRFFFGKMRQLTRDIRESESRVQSHIQESLQHKTVIQSLEGGDMAEERLDDLQQTEFGQVLRRTRFNVISRSIISVAFSAGYATAFIWSAFGIWHGTTTYGMMTAFLQLVGQIQGPLVRLT
ncbi:MAG: ABC transporter ATP-binding protein, partial [Bacteroidales bacterium]|nr:ABC transporter ATP-binding protein [Bacteroidales bacterium]